VINIVDTEQFRAVELFIDNVLVGALDPENVTEFVMVMGARKG
jgi:hypothetical protein